jgi:hypothetical protein
MAASKNSRDKRPHGVFRDPSLGLDALLSSGCEKPLPLGSGSRGQRMTPELRQASRQSVSHEGREGTLYCKFYVAEITVFDSTSGHLPVIPPDVRAGDSTKLQHRNRQKFLLTKG